MANFWYLHSRFALVSALTLSLGLVGAGCSGEGDDDDDDSSQTEQTPTPTPPEEFDGEISITTPRDGARIPLSQNQTIVVQFEVEDFTLREAGQCGDRINTCGRVKASVDGQASTVTETTSSPVVLDLSGLSSPVGEHTVTLELILDNGTATGAKSEITIETTDPEAPEAPVPAIAGVSLTDLHNVGDDGMQTFRFRILAANFTFLADENATECEPFEGPDGEPVEVVNCGYAGISIDGDEGNAPDLEFNNFAYGVQEPDGSIEAEAYFTYIDDPSGQHEITVTLLQADGTPYQVPLPGGGTQNVAVTSTLNFVDEDAANITITDPDGGAVKVGEDELMTVPVAFDVSNFTLQEPGSCGGNLTTCGHVHVLLDAEDEDAGNDGNAPGLPYNNAGASSPINAYFAYLPETQTGLHTITLALHNDNHEPITVDFGGETREVRSFRAITALPSDNPTVVIDNPQDGADNVQISAQNDNTATFRYTVTNFSLIDEGDDCPEDVEQTSWDESEQCGWVQINVDGDDCNQSGQDYNNVDASAPTADVLFGECNVAIGAHTVTFALIDYNGNPVVVNGDPVEHTISVTTTPSTRP